MTDLYVQDLSPAVQHGVAAVEKGDFETAWKVFSQLNAQEPGNAIVLSYLGVLLALRSGKVYEGLEQCQMALKKDPGESLSYLNLSRCYLAAGDRYQAVRAIHKGLKLKSPHHGVLVSFYKAMGMRRKPVLGFLHRDNPVNIFLGKLTWRWQGRDMRRHPTLRRSRKWSGGA